MKLENIKRKLIDLENSRNGKGQLIGHYPRNVADFARESEELYIPLLSLALQLACLECLKAHKDYPVRDPDFYLNMAEKELFKKS